jgi:hypothetical protein
LAWSQVAADLGREVDDPLDLLVERGDRVLGPLGVPCLDPPAQLLEATAIARSVRSLYAGLP